MAARRTTPPIRITSLDKANVSASEAEPAETTFVSLRDTGQSRNVEGLWQPVNALMPNLFDYHKIIFFFDTTIAGTTTGAEIRLLERTADGGVIEVERSVLDAQNNFPQLEIDNHDARYNVQLVNVTGAAPDVSFNVYIMGLFVPDYVATS